MNDYCIADCIYHLSNNPKNPSVGWCFASKQYIATELGITKAWVVRSIAALEGRGLIEKSPDGRLLRTTQAWYDANIDQYTDGVRSIPESVNGEHRPGIEGIPPTESKSYKKKKSNEGRTPDEREKEFGLRLVPFVEKYGKEMIRKFHDYWTEWNPAKTKMKWEIQVQRKGTFDVSRRLATWAGNNQTFGPAKTNGTGQQLDVVSNPESYRVA